MFRESEFVEFCPLREGTTAISTPRPQVGHHVARDFERPITCSLSRTFPEEGVNFCQFQKSADPTIWTPSYCHPQMRGPASPLIEGPL